MSTQRVVEWTHNNKLCAHTYKESWLLYLTFSSSCGVEQNEPFCPWPLIALGKLQQQHLRSLLNLRTGAFQNRVAPSPLSELRLKGKYSVKAPQEDSFLIPAYWVGQDQIGLRPVWAESCLQLCSTSVSPLPAVWTPVLLLLEVFFKDCWLCDKKIPSKPQTGMFLFTQRKLFYLHSLNSERSS